MLRPFQDLSQEEKKNRKKKQRVLKNLHAKEDESSKFLSDFNPSSDRKAKSRVQPNICDIEGISFKL